MDERIKIASVMTIILVVGATIGWTIGSAYESNAPSWEQILYQAKMSIHNEYSSCEYLGYRLDFKNNASLIGSTGASTKMIHIYDCDGIRKEAMHDHEKLVANEPQPLEVSDD